MQSIVSGLTKLFTSIGSGAASLGNALRGVGNALFTGMAATGTGLAGASAGGPLAGLLGGGGVLGNMLSGAITQGLSGGLAGGLMSSIAGEGFGSGFKQGAISGAIGGAATGGISSLFAPTGFGAATGGGDIYNQDVMAGGAGTVGGADRLIGAGGGNGTAGGGRTDVMVSPHAQERGRDALAVGASALTPDPVPPPPVPPVPTPPPIPGSGFPPVPQPPTTGFGKLTDFLQTNAGASLIGGMGEALTAERYIEAQKEIAEENRNYLRERDQRRTDSYKVDASSLVGGTPNAAANASSKTSGPARWAYNPGTGMIDYA